MVRLTEAATQAHGSDLPDDRRLARRVLRQPSVQFGLRLIGDLPGRPLAGHGLLGLPGHAAAVGQPDPAVRRGRRASSCSPRSSSSSPSGSTRSSGRTRRSARSGSGTWPRRPCSPRSSRSTTARLRSPDRRRMDHLPELPDPPEARLSRTAAGWSGWTGRCAPGAARTSSDARSRRPRSRRCRGPRGDRPGRRSRRRPRPRPTTRSDPSAPLRRPASRRARDDRRSRRPPRIRCPSVEPRRTRRPSPDPDRRPGDRAGPPTPERPGISTFTIEGRSAPGPVRRRLAGDARSASACILTRSWRRTRTRGRILLHRRPGRCCRSA